MSIRKTLFAALSLFLLLSNVSAQNTNSVYSRYGYGILDNPALGKSRAMGGIGYGLRDNGSINMLNPASYSAVDTMNFVFDFGVSSSYSRFEENGQKQSNPNGKFDYVAMKIPLKKYWGATLGLVPYSNVGYSFSSDETTSTGDVNYTKTYQGSGGLNTVFLGTGISLGKHVSLGANMKYVFGSLVYSGSTTYESSSIYSYYPSKTVYLGAPSLDLGFQYQTKVGKKGRAVLGATFTNGSAFTMNDIYSVKLTPGVDTVTTTTHANYDLPNTIGFGASYTYDNRFTVGLDFQKQAWSKTSFAGVKDSLADNTKIAFGMEYLPSLLARSYFNAIKYRFGVQYNDSYLKLPQGNLKNVGVSLGFGLPLKNQRSVINLSFEAGKMITPTSTIIQENYYRVSLDMSFNEVWFFKRKL